jgi:hypothetical protein
MEALPNAPHGKGTNGVISLHPWDDYFWDPHDTYEVTHLPGTFRDSWGGGGSLSLVEGEHLMPACIQQAMLTCS